MKKWLKVFLMMFLIAFMLSLTTVIYRNSDTSDPVRRRSDSSGTSSDASGEQGTKAPTPPPVTPQENGWVSKDGGDFYYVNGVLQKDTIVGSDADGYWYVNQNGLKDPGYCDALTIDGKEWNVIESKATPVVDDWDEALHSALKDIAKCTDSTMTREEKLRASFDYLKEAYLEGVRHDPPYNEMDWPVVCANDLFVYGKGDCFSYGAAFAFYAKAIGYEECYASNSGGHGWAEINGLYYDPEWDMHHQEYNHFGVGPDDPCDVDYSNALMDGVDWMKIKV